VPDQGCFAGLDTFIRTRGDILLPEAWLLTGSRDSGEELLQEALVRLLRRWRAKRREILTADLQDRCAGRMSDTVEAGRAYVASGGDKNRVIPVYESDGTTKIGVFVIGGHWGKAQSCRDSRKAAKAM
jgi:hypothetical protein